MEEVGGDSWLLRGSFSFLPLYLTPDFCIDKEGLNRCFIRQDSFSVKPLQMTSHYGHMWVFPQVTLSGNTARGISVWEIQIQSHWQQRLVTWCRWGKERDFCSFRPSLCASPVPRTTETPRVMGRTGDSKGHTPNYGLFLNWCRQELTNWAVVIILELSLTFCLLFWAY